MKQRTYIFTIAAILLVSFFSTLNTAQIKDHVSSKTYNQYILNLQSGIKSDNLGLKKNAVYFTGIYQIEENIPLLVEEYKKSTDKNLQDIIVFAIYVMDDKKALNEINFTEADIKNNSLLVEVADGVKLTSKLVLKEIIKK